MDPINLHEFEQSSQAMVDNLPALWWGLYSRCVEQGFTKEQAMTCVLTMITASMQREK